MQYFRINPNTAKLYPTIRLDLESLKSSKFSLEKTAQQRQNELKTATASIEISVIDLNDNKPEFKVEQYNMTVIENLPAGFRIIQFTAAGRNTGDNAKLIYKLDDPSQAFGLKGNINLVLQKPELFDINLT